MRVERDWPRRRTAAAFRSRAAARAARLPTAQHEIYFAGRLWQADVLFAASNCTPGDQIRGPAIVGEPLTTTVIDPGWQAEVLSGGELLLTHHRTFSPNPPMAPSLRMRIADPVLLEIFNNQFAAIAEQMGITLRNTSSSVNVKERLDFSCAIFTATGDLVVNAPHIPVHLGAMGETVKRIIADNPRSQPGDVFVTNDPYRGGSHLPDVTVVTPVHVTQRLGRSCCSSPPAGRIMPRSAASRRARCRRSRRTSPKKAC